MAFILGEERDADCARAYRNYREYLKKVCDRFPPSALELARSDWYYNFNDHRCPHDAWLESLTIDEPSEGSRHELRRNTIRVRLLGAYHDGHIEFTYPQVFSYQLTLPDAAKGHQDWRYDEFLFTENGNLRHEIEWCGGRAAGGRWRIEASDVLYRWIPTAGGPQ